METNLDLNIDGQEIDLSNASGNAINNCGRRPHFMNTKKGQAWAKCNSAYNASVTSVKSCPAFIRNQISQLTAQLHNYTIRVNRIGIIETSSKLSELEHDYPNCF